MHEQTLQPDQTAPPMEQFDQSKLCYSEVHFETSPGSKIGLCNFLISTIHSYTVQPFTVFMVVCFMS